jgi:hypothetical protein
MVNSWGQFFDLVVKMREAQKEYFKFRAPSDVARCKTLEKEVDDCISAHQVKQVKQGDLFAGKK